MPLTEAHALEAHTAVLPAAGTVSSAAALPAAASQAGAADVPLAPFMVAHDPRADEQVLEQLAQWCEQFSPLVGFEQLDPCHGSSAARRPDCLYLDVTNLAAYFGDERKLARLVTQSFMQRGYHVRVALASTLGAAWALAHFAVPAAEVIGASSTGMAEPAAARGSSFLVVPPGATGEALQSLPIEALRLPPEAVSLLQQLGIYQIAQLACLPRASLLSRFGAVLLRRWDQAFGAVDEVLLMFRPAPQFRTDWTLEYPTTDQATIHAVLDELTERLTAALARRGEGVVECSCRLFLANPPTPSALHPQPSFLTDHPALSPLALRIGLFQPTASARHLQQLWQLQMQQVLLPAPVQQILLEATLTAPLQRRQRELFPDTIRHTSQQLAQLVDRLSSRLGQAHVVRPRLYADAQPEFAYHYLPLTGNPRARKPLPGKRRATAVAARPAGLATAPRSAVRLPGSRPLHLRSPPLPIDVVAVAPDGPPVRLLWDNHPYQVARYWGPERIETGWWRGRSVRRDYYRVETQSGHWLWLFRRLSDGHWFLHGMFG